MLQPRQNLVFNIYNSTDSEYVSPNPSNPPTLLHREVLLHLAIITLYIRG